MLPRGKLPAGCMELLFAVSVVWKAWAAVSGG